MNTLQSLYPGDEVAALVIFTLLHLTVVIGLAALVTRFLTASHAAARHTIWLCTFLWVLLSPLLPLTGTTLGWSSLTVSLPLPEEPPEIEQPTTARQETVASVTPPSAPPTIAPVLPSNTEPVSLDPPQPTEVSSLPSGQPELEAVETTPALSFPTSQDTEGSAPLPIRESLGGVLVALWLLGILFVLGRTARVFFHVRRLRHHATPLSDRYRSLLQRVSHRLALPHFLQVRCTDRFPAPVVVGLFRPTVLLPTCLLSSLDDDALEDMLVHEGAHVMRHDLVIGHLQRLVAILFWPHPLVPFLNRQLSRAREEVCDNHVLTTGSATRYAGTLLTVAESMPSRRPLAIGEALLPARWNLEQRIAGLLDHRRRLSLRSPRGLAGTLLLSLGVAGALVAGVQIAPPELPSNSEPAAESPPQAKPKAKPEDDFQIVKGLSLALTNSVSDYQHGEPLRFQLTLRNDSKKAFRLMDPSRLYRGSDPTKYAQWTHSFPPSTWTGEANVKDRRAVLIRGLKPGESISIPVLLDDPFYYAPKDKLRGEPTAHLPAGIYQYQPTLKFSGVRDNNPIPFWTGEITALSPKFTIKKRPIPSNISWGKTQQGVRIGLSPGKHYWFTNQPALKVKVWYQNSSSNPLKVPRHHMERYDANASFLKFSGRSQEKPFSLTYSIERSATAYPEEVALAPGEVFWEEFTIKEEARPAQKGLHFWGLPRPAAGQRMSLQAHYSPGLEIDGLKKDDKRIINSGAIQVTSLKPQGAAAAAAIPLSSVTFDSGTSALGQWRVHLSRNSLYVTHEWKGKVRKYQGALVVKEKLANAWKLIDSLPFPAQSAEQLRPGKTGEQIMTFTLRKPDGSTHDHAQWSSTLAAHPVTKQLLDELATITTGHAGLLTLWPPPSPPLTEKQAKWVAALNAKASTFTLDLVFLGEQNKPYYTLHLSVPPFPNNEAPFGFNRHHRITEAQAKKIIDHLAANRFFQEYEKTARLAQSPRPSYSLQIEAGDLQFREILEFNPHLFQRLDGLRPLFEGPIDSSLDLVSGRISGWRRILLEKLTKPTAEP